MAPPARLLFSCALLAGRFVALGAACWCARQATAVPPRQPPPDEAAAEAALDVIRQAYEEEYKSAATDPEPLIRKLLADAEESQDPASDYVLLLEAEKAAVAGGAVGRAMEAVDARAEQFEIDGLLARAETITDCLTPKTRADVGQLDVLWEYAIETAERGLEKEALPQAKKAVEVAGNVAKAIFAAGKTRKDDALVTAGERKQVLAKGLLKTIGRRTVLLAEYRKAVEKLTGDADEPKANGTVGRYLCFERDAWEEGLPALAKGDDEKLAAAAARELQLFAADAGQPDTGDVLALADAWWQAAEADAIRRHAAALYDRVLADIGDPTKRALAAKRIAAAHPAAEPQHPGQEPDAPRRPVGGGRRGAILNVPSSIVLPVPRELSAELVPLLLSEEDVQMLQNRLNVKDDELVGMRAELYSRIHSRFGSARWSTVDLLYLLELNDRLGGLLGQYEWRTPTGDVIGGDAKPETRKECKAAIAAAWILTAQNEDDFIRRARAVPPGVLERSSVEGHFNESQIKRWLVGLGDDYAPIPRKTRALDSLIQAGLATPGMLRYRDELGRAAASGQR